MKKLIKVSAVFLGLAVIIIAVMMIMGKSVKSSDIILKPAEVGTLESSISATGKIVENPGADDPCGQG